MRSAREIAETAGVSLEQARMILRDFQQRGVAERSEDGWVLTDAWRAHLAGGWPPSPLDVQRGEP